MSRWEKDRETYVDWRNKHPKVNEWGYGAKNNFKDEPTRRLYVSSLRSLSHEVGVEPDQFLVLARNEPSPLNTKTRQHLESLSTKMPAKSRNEKAALTRFVQFYSDLPQKFQFNAHISQEQIRDHPQWGREEYLKILSFVMPKYRPIFQLGAMVGFGRKELCYLNDHLSDVKPVPDVSEAVMLEGMPPRKPKGSGVKKKWIAVLPAREYDEYKKTAPLMTIWGKPIGRGDLTNAFKKACKLAGKEYDILGTSGHILRSIFETVGSSQPPGGVNVDNKYLQQNMGHAPADGLQYNQTHLRLVNVQERARALIPLWDFFRNGPPVVSSQEMSKFQEQLNERLEAQREEYKKALVLALRLGEGSPSKKFADILLSGENVPTLVREIVDEGKAEVLQEGAEAKLLAVPDRRPVKKKTKSAAKREA